MDIRNYQQRFFNTLNVTLSENKEIKISKYGPYPTATISVRGL
jgi:hypothetical protein